MSGPALESRPGARALVGLLDRGRQAGVAAELAGTPGARDLADLGSQRDNPFEADAKKAEKEGAALVMDAIQDDIDSAKESIEDAAKLAADTEPQVKGSADSFDELRHDAEAEYER